MKYSIFALSLIFYSAAARNYLAKTHTILSLKTTDDDEVWETDDYGDSWYYDSDGDEYYFDAEGDLFYENSDGTSGYDEYVNGYSDYWEVDDSGTLEGYDSLGNSWYSTAFEYVYLEAGGYEEINYYAANGDWWGESNEEVYWYYDHDGCTVNYWYGYGYAYHTYCDTNGTYG
jgi:hypothetical protein